MKFAIIVFVITLGSFTAIAQPIGRTDDSQRRGEGRRERSFPATPDVFRGSTDMVATGNYELRCRGGNSLSFQSVGSRTHSSRAVMTTLELSFSPSSQSAGANSGGLQPGECALADRAFYLDEVGQVREPLRVRFETPANAQLKQTQSGGAVDRSSTRAENYPDENSIPEYLRNSDRYWSFYVSNTGQGYFLAGSNQHWKPRVEGSKLRNSGSLIRLP